MIVAVIMVLLRHFNIDGITEDAVSNFVSAVFVAIGFLWMIWGQIRGRKDLVAGLIRK